MNAPYKFRKVLRDDMPQLKSWLAEPFVRKWWGDPDEEIADIENDMREGKVRQWIVSLEGIEFAYIQDYDVHDWGEEALSHFPPKTRGIDVFIGHEGWLGKGHGSEIVRILSQQMLGDGIPEIIIDPDPKNSIAIKAYQKAGFGDGRHVLLEGEPALLMIYLK